MIGRLIASLILLTEVALCGLLSKSAFPFVLIGAILALALALQMHRWWSRSLMSLSGISLLGVALLFIPVLQHKGFLALAMIPQIIQIFAFYSAGTRPHVDVEFRHSTRSTATWVFVICGTLNVYVAFTAGRFLPPTTGGFAGTIILLLLMAVLDIGLEQEHADPSDRASRWQTKMIAPSVLLGACVALAIASLLTPPLLRSADAIRSVLREPEIKPIAEQPPKPPRKKPAEGTNAPSTLIITNEIEETCTPEHSLFRIQVNRDSRSSGARQQDRVYVRVYAFDTYLNREWRSTAAARARLDKNDGAKDGRITLEGSASNTIAYTLYANGDKSDRLPAIPGVVQADLPSLLEIEEDTFATPSTRVLPRYFYSMISSPALWNDLPKGSSSISNVAESFSSIPDPGLRKAIASIFPETQNIEGDNGVIISNLQATMQEKFYVTAPNPADVSEPGAIESCLETRTGAVTRLAGTLVLALRNAGIPARLATGYVAREKTDNMYWFFPGNSHSWAEVPLKNHGWVIVDPFFPKILPRISGDGLDVGAEQYPSLAGFMEKGRPGFSSISWLARASPPLFMCSTIVLIALIIVLARRTWSPAKRLKPGLHSEPVPPPGFYNLFCSYFAQRGCRKKPGQTGREYLSELKRRKLIGTEYDDLIEYLYGICYEGRSRHLLRESQWKMRLWHRSLTLTQAEEPSSSSLTT